MDQEFTQQKLATLFGVSRVTIIRWRQRGHIKPLREDPQPGIANQNKQYIFGWDAVKRIYLHLNYPDHYGFQVTYDQKDLDYAMKRVKITIERIEHAA